MGRVVFDISISLDGYMTADGRTADVPRLRAVSG